MSDSWETMWYAGAASSECASDVHTCRPRISVMGIVCRDLGPYIVTGEG